MVIGITVVTTVFSDPDYAKSAETRQTSVVKDW